MSGPLPPVDLSSREPDLVRLKVGTAIHRFYTVTYDPVHFDKSRHGRFNAPDGSYGVMYTAESQAGAFAETFLRVPGRTLIDGDLLDRKAYLRLSVTRSIRLIRMTGAGLARIGATAEVTHCGLPYDVPLAWSGALSLHPLEADGIAYHSRHDDEQLCYALFDSTIAAVREEARETNLDQEWFWTLAERYRIGLSP